MERLRTLPLQNTLNNEFIRRVEEYSGQKISKCYQCGNCSASCNYTYTYDYPVHQIMRLVQLGQKEAVLRSDSIWLCASCQACTTRCPNNIDVAGVMRALRVMSVQEATVSRKNIRMFYEEFIKSVRMFGRVFEPGLLAKYNLRAFKPFNDADLGPKVLFKGKLSLLPHRAGCRAQIAEIFDRFEAYEKEQKKSRES